jgi:ABC-type phosphate/phosphonate transport system substrate-binding protein
MNDTPLIACSRMYNVSPAIRARWDDLFTWASDQAGVALEIIAHAVPAPLPELWARPDMGAVFMCGYPFSRLPEDERPVILAAPVCKASWSGDRPRYASHIVVTANGPSCSSMDIDKAVWGWTVRDSQSGYHAPRAFLAGHSRENPAVMRTVGPLVNPTGILEALHAGRIDVGAIDAYAYELLSLHEPTILTGLKIIATTEPMPCPMLVAARAAPARQVSALREALLQAHESAGGRAVLDPLALARFELPDAEDYRVLPELADATNLRIPQW